MRKEEAINHQQLDVDCFYNYKRILRQDLYMSYFSYFVFWCNTLGS